MLLRKDGMYLQLHKAWQPRRPTSTGSMLLKLIQTGVSSGLVRGTQRSASEVTHNEELVFWNLALHQQQHLLVPLSDSCSPVTQPPHTRNQPSYSKTPAYPPFLIWYFSLQPSEQISSQAAPAAWNGVEHLPILPNHPLNSTVPSSQGENSSRNKWDSKTRNMATNSNIFVFTIGNESRRYTPHRKTWRRKGFFTSISMMPKEPTILTAIKPPSLFQPHAAAPKGGGANP